MSEERDIVKFRISNIMQVALSESEFRFSLFENMSDQEWEDLFKFSMKQDVSAICSFAFEKDSSIAIPIDILLKFSGMREVARLDYFQKKNATSNLLNFYSSNGIKTMILKGFSLNRYYPDPTIKTSSDVDLYLFGDYKKADSLLESQLGIEIERGIPHHTTFTYQNVPFENHFEIVNTSAHISSRKYETMLLSLLKTGCRTLDDFCIPCYSASPTFQVMLLFRHLATHFVSEKVTLRQLADIALLCKNEKDSIDWNYVSLMFTQFGMTNFVGAIADSISSIFGYSLPEEIRYVTPKALSDRVLNDILFPEFVKSESKTGLMRLLWKWKRYKANRWKHGIVFKESEFDDFLFSIFRKLLMPKTIIR